MITRNFNLFLNAGNSIPLVINVNQFDSGEQWVFTLFNSDGTQYIPSTGAIVGIKSDGLGIINSGSVNESGQVVISETQQMTAAVGKAVFELMIDNQTHGTANFVVLVEEKPGNNADLSESDLSLLEEAISATSPLPTGGTVGQVLTKTANGSTWSDAGTPTQEQVADAVSDWADEHITVTTGVVIDDSLSVAGAAADAKATGDELADLKSAIQSGGGFNAEVKSALETLLANVVYKGDDPTGRTYLTALHNAMYPPANLSYITAVYTQSGTVYPSDSLDSLKSDLVVTAHYSDSTTAVVTTYALTGTLTAGTSTITVTYGGKTTTFNVTVSGYEYPLNLNFPLADIELTDGYINDSGEVVALADNKFYNELIPAVGFAMVNSSDEIVTSANGSLRLAEYDSSQNFVSRKYIQRTGYIIGDNDPSYIKMGFADSGGVWGATGNTFVGLNVIDTSLCTIPDSTIATDGTIATQTGMSVSDYLPIESGYVVGAVKYGADTLVIAFYSSSKALIQRNAVVTSGGGAKVFAVPENTAYVRFRCDTNPQGTEYISYVR